MIISINNQKGGVAKTTTSQALTHGLSLKGYKVLAIDLDPQANLTYGIGANEDVPDTIYEVLSSKSTIKAAIQKINDIHVIPSNILLSGADIEFTRTGREYLLKEVLKDIKSNYDFIILDTPPNLGILTINALTATDKVIIPMSADAYSLKGLSQLYNTIKEVKKYTNPVLEIEGLLLTRYNNRTILNRDLKEVIEEAAKNIETKLFNTVIRETIALRESQVNQQSIFDYAPGNNTAEDYQSLINELLGVM